MPSNPARSLPLFLLAASVLFVAPWASAAKPNKAEVRELKREMGADVPGVKVGKRDDNADLRPGKPAPGAAESRVMSRLREHLEVTDDAEWALIAERIKKVEEARRILSTGAGGRGSGALSDKGKHTGRTGASAHPEQDALRAAVGDKLPDAEIRARLARAHEVYQQNEARLAQAQADLRAVLTVRQEAVAVVAGVLPP